MAYIEGRVVHDADAHVMETAEWFDMLLDGTVDERVQATFKQGFGEEERGFYEQIERLQRDPAHRAKDAEELMARKNHHAIGAFLKEDRTHALDLLGVASQLLITSRGNVLLESLEHGDDLDLLYGTASASNRAQVEYSRVDRRPRNAHVDTPRATWVWTRFGRRRRMRGCQSCSTSVSRTACCPKPTRTTACLQCPTFMVATRTFARFHTCRSLRCRCKPCHC